MNKIKNFLTLVKLEGSVIKGGSTTKAKNKKIITIILIVFALIYFLSIGYSLSKELIKGLTEIGAESYFTIIIVLVMFLFSLMTAITTSGVQIMQDKTNIILNTYPISSQKRFMAHFISYLQKTYTFAIGIGLVPLIYFGIAKNSGIDYYLMVLIAVAILPLLSSIIIYAIMFLLNGFIKLFVSKKFLKWVGFASMFVFIIIYTYLWNRMFNATDIVQQILKIVQGLETNPILWYPKQIANIIIGPNRWESLAIVLGMNIIATILIYMTIGKVYIKEQLRIASFGTGIGILNYIKSKNDESKKDLDISEIDSSKVKNLNKGNEILKDLKYKKKNLSFEYFKNEFKFFLKDPNVAANTILIPIILPIFMIIGTVASLSTRLDTIKKETNIYLIKELSLVSENKAEIEEVAEAPGFEYQVLEDNNGIYTLSKYELIMGNDLKQKIGSDKLEEKLKNSKSENLDDYVTIVKEFDSETLKTDNETIEKYISNNEEMFAHSEKLIDDLFFTLNYDKNAYNSENVFKFIWFNRNLIRDQIALGIDKYLVFLLPVMVTVAGHFFTTISLFMISKDKNERQFFRSIPLSHLKQFNLKRLPGIFVKIVFLTLYTIGFELLLDSKLYTMPFFWLGILFSLLLIILNETVEIYLDSRKPNFNWKTPVYLVKQTLKVFLAFLVKTLIIVGLILLYYFVFYKNNIGLNIYVYILVSTVSLLVLTLETIIYRQRDRLLEKM